MGNRKIPKKIRGDGPWGKYVKMCALEGQGGNMGTKESAGAGEEGDLGRDDLGATGLEAVSGECF